VNAPVTEADDGASPPPVTPQVSVVVPTYNRCAGLQRLLDGLTRQTYPADAFEVLIVDDGSADGTVAATERRRTPFARRLLRQPHQGPAAARNLGVANARGELVLFLDDDVLPRPDVIAAHVAVHRASPATVAIGPMYPPPDWPRAAWVRWEEEKLAWQYAAMAEGKFECSPRQFYTANASLPAALFRAAGGFDARFSRAEDVELGFRLRDHGARFAFLPDAGVFHYASRSFESWCRTPYQYGRFDVVMQREKGHETLELATEEFHSRHPVNRALARLCVGRRGLTRVAVSALRLAAAAADTLGDRTRAALALSGIFNLLYWQGVCDELGGADAVWRRVDGAHPAATAGAVE
jgi:GT2 family glycosyltransferase